MDTDYRGFESVEFRNSWLFSPIVWDVLMEKYLCRYNRSQFIENGTKPIGFMSAMRFNKCLNINRKLNEKINNCDCMSDRVLWEMANQQIFFTKDKIFVSNCIKEFLNLNASYMSEYGGHITERFLEISECILNVDENESPCFIFKNTSVDDNVEYWFEKYDEDTGEYIDRALTELDERVSEFVLISNGNMDFVSNIDFFKEDKSS